MLTNPHPYFAAFPVALLTVVGIIEIISIFRKDLIFTRVLRVNLIFAALFTLAAFLSGYLAFDDANQTFVIPEKLINQHHLIGKVLLFAVFPCVVLKFVSDFAKVYRRSFYAAYIAFLLLSILLVYYSGLLGGKLVFEHGAGVNIKFR